MELPDATWITKWFHTLFIYSFPMEIVTRFWDYIIATNLFSMIKISIAIIKKY